MSGSHWLAHHFFPLCYHMVIGEGTCLILMAAKQTIEILAHLSIRVWEELCFVELYHWHIILFIRMPYGPFCPLYEIKNVSTQPWIHFLFSLTNISVSFKIFWDWDLWTLDNWDFSSSVSQTFHSPSNPSDIQTPASGFDFTLQHRFSSPLCRLFSLLPQPPPPQVLSIHSRNAVGEHYASDLING